jgi:hypothetical protein
MMRTSLVLVLAALFTAGCDDNDFELQSELARVRVLAIKAEPAELAFTGQDTPPAPVSFSSLSYSPTGAQVAVTYALCFAGNPYDAAFECPGKDGLPLPDGRLDLTDPAVQEVLTALASALGDQVDAGGGAVDVEAALRVGIPLVVGYEARDGSEGPTGLERGTRRITLRQTAQPNANPVITEVQVDGGVPAGPLPAATELALRPLLAEGSLERYAAADGGEVTEQPFYSWYATGDGELQQLRSLEPTGGRPGEPTVEYLTPSTAQRVTVYVVARDERGGTGWLVRELDVAPAAAPQP